MCRRRVASIHLYAHESRTEPVHMNKGSTLIDGCLHLSRYMRWDIQEPETIKSRMFLLGQLYGLGESPEFWHLFENLRIHAASSESRNHQILEVFKRKMIGFGKIIRISDSGLESQNPSQMPRARNHQISCDSIKKMIWFGMNRQNLGSCSRISGSSPQAQESRKHWIS